MQGKETNAALNDSRVSKYNDFCKAGYLSSNFVTFISTLLQIKKILITLYFYTCISYNIMKGCSKTVLVYIFSDMIIKN